MYGACMELVALTAFKLSDLQTPSNSKPNFVDDYLVIIWSCSCADCELCVFPNQASLGYQAIVLPGYQKKKHIGAA